MSRYMWERDGYVGGLLFSLCYSETADYKDYLPSYQDLGPGAEGYYYLVFPTDFQAYPDIDSICDEYKDMWTDIGFVQDNSFSFLSLNQPVG